MGGRRFWHFQTWLCFTKKNPEEPNERSRLIPKDNADSQQVPDGEDSEEEQHSAYSCPELVVTKSMSTKNWPRPMTHLPTLLVFIKYLMFITNFVFSVVGFTILGIGFWGLIDKQSLISEKIGSLGTDPMLFFILVGLVICALSVSGCVGFLRENICLLKLFSAGMCVLIVIQSVLAIAFLSFREQIQDSVKQSMMVALTRYQDDSDLRFIMDEIQLGMECCGVQSYQDWGVNLYFNCSSAGVHSCGVPYSCCIDPLENGTVPNSQCGFKVQEMGETLAGSTVYLGGCVPQLSLWLSRRFWDIASGFLLVTAIELINVSCAQRILGEIMFGKNTMEGLGRPKHHEWTFTDQK
ncbi:tetraspanin-10 [Pelobates cultripes]|uniref:Tetraspanin-10 n=1 Tax=Pelobates cultripes TaxID=61616 RepID=A0AAD1W6U5_PELCU|nr:tetraspanin-10 [Pelobates cultripes]